MDNEMNTEVTCVKGHTFLAESDMEESQPIPEWLCPDCVDEWRGRVTKTFTVPLADDLATEICRVLDIETGTVARMIIDLQAGQPVKIYLDTYADKAIEGIDWARFLTGAVVKKETLTEEILRKGEASHWTGLKTDYGSKTT